MGLANLLVHFENEEKLLTTMLRKTVEHIQHQ
jgi:hypothetical protein